ncbi:N-acetyl-1-D-myo-inositol-2-amino-2-deoxy-alpha-D-glucopyranoside deacetylase [Streptomyces alkaliterrae]|uniref:1D-myo-inositol 2-acetamido-2-deoxy-alpha-D-glucopyranoside deacetylase n=1 Tax=Streptomyces alkaliterrae TaxID=2213162 RepID=A0A5P0YTW6_9ACTN|nr:N-acetyl-1-D-myo-inositol-2-amino-2-deoxy-alpha-D-glucopyranoside deacetylase [Streptomyces alkaliterrae]MBB1254547.1 N-acetyl-1-D-myo-inositol-2-amino-2-deoxy-alpha-D-glucopyranoside deacetylase [Streptomyces alkaliterrae]MBB1258170.1 N-acetyl-1-D-myo-inositol-2-amino-2-deoxy-alpha-D-glucopyranoside deacetylase [Streptomyces alkaliterrae]MQS01919.1 N-acetyl-1-D-myo-inositol-2-amino-2-deoxy-alpha-D-glucopyranoside deacetylase [Streptomyces alkaliterrae]
MSAPSNRPRLLLVHAHPDDESINNGVTMARYAAQGAAVTLVTCTLGEEGEVIPEDLAHLAPDRGDNLGPYRIGELAAAMRELGVSDHRFLGGPGRYRDSGMMGTPQNDRPECFWQAPLDEAAALLVETVRETRPHVLVTYDPDGGYGHPDHIKAHRVATRAAELAADPAFRPELGEPHRIARTYWNCVPLSAVDAEAFAANPFPGDTDVSDIPGVVPDELVAVRIEGGERYAAAKAAAMSAHATQIVVEGAHFALSNGLGQPVQTTECYRLPDGSRPPGPPATDLFAGVEL